MGSVKKVVRERLHFRDIVFLCIYVYKVDRLRWGAVVSLQPNEIKFDYQN